jgi:hypothetical protein
MGRAGALIVLLLAAPAAAQPCLEEPTAGPLLAGPGAADFGQVPETCPVTALDLRQRGELLVDTPDFYGTVQLGTTLRARWRFWHRWVASAALDPATWRFAANAVVQSTGVGVGPGTLGLARLFQLRSYELTPYARLLLPIDTARHYGARWGAEVGAAIRRQLTGRLALQGGVAIPSTLVVVGGLGHYGLTPGALVEAAYTPRWWLALAAGAAARVAVAPDAQLAALAARASTRFHLRSGWNFGVGLDVPVVANDRTDLTATLFAGWSPSFVPDSQRPRVLE